MTAAGAQRKSSLRRSATCCSSGDSSMLSRNLSSFSAKISGMINESLSSTGTSGVVVASVEKRLLFAFVFPDVDGRDDAEGKEDVEGRADVDGRDDAEDRDDGDDADVEGFRSGVSAAVGLSGVTVSSDFE